MCPTYRVRRSPRVRLRSGYAGVFRQSPEYLRSNKERSISFTQHNHQNRFAEGEIIQIFYRFTMFLVTFKSNIFSMVQTFFEIYLSRFCHSQGSV